MRKINKKLVAVAAGTSLALVAGGVAYAYWTTTGTGGGSSTSSATAPTVAYVADFDAATLAPGGSVSVTYSATNSSATDLSVAAPSATVSSDKSYTDGSGHPQSCADFLHLSAQPTGGPVAHNNSADLGTASLSMDNSSLSQDSCKGQTVTITLSNS